MRNGWIAALLLTALVSSRTQAQNVPPQGGPLEQGLGQRGTLPSAAPPRPLVLAGAIDPATYRLGPGDELELQIRGQVTRTYSLIVGPEGALLLPQSGLVEVNGLTLEAARRKILAQLRRDYRDVSMELTLSRPRLFRVTLTGAVTRPGPLEAMGAARASDLLSTESLQPSASRRRIEVRHRDGSIELADLERLTRLGDPGRDPLLRDGDVVHVPIATEFVYSSGALASPGRFERAPDDSVCTLVRLSGGLLPSAAPTGALLLSWHGMDRADSLRLSLQDLTGEPGARKLSDGDRLYVYFVSEYRMQHEVTVLGEITRPGNYPIREGLTHLTEVMSAAGDFLPTADLSAIRVHRRNEHGAEKDPELDRLLRLSRGELTASEYEGLRTKLAGMREDYRVDWGSVQRAPGSLDLLLLDGDIIRVDRLVSTVRVDGEVRAPAILAYKRGLTVSEYVRQAGGFTGRAWRGKVRVTRAVTGQTLLASQVSALDPGDFIWVPEKPDVTAWQQARDILSALAQVAAIVIAIRSVR